MTSEIKRKILSELNMVYFLLFFVGLIFISVPIGYFYGRFDAIGKVRGLYEMRYYAQDLTVSVFGTNINLKIDNSDKATAWKIYNEIQTRVGAVAFNESYDSFLVANESLYNLFQTVRNELTNLPVSKIKQDRGLVIFYHNILNKGIRPYLSKWHIPIEHHHKLNASKGLSIIEIEKTFPKRKEIIADIAELNIRMKNMSDELLKIIEAD